MTWRRMSSRRALAFAYQVALGGDELPPEFAPFPPAVVGGVVAKAEKQGEDDAEDGEADYGRGGQVKPMVVRADAQQERHARQQQHGGQDFGEYGAAPCE